VRSGGTLLLSTVLYGKVCRDSGTWLTCPTRSASAQPACHHLLIASTSEGFETAFAVASL
jgi:hypothetical protein